MLHTIAIMSTDDSNVRVRSDGTLHGSGRRALRIAGASGGVFDRFRSIQDLAADPSIDVIFGDCMHTPTVTDSGLFC